MSNVDEGNSLNADGGSDAKDITSQMFGTNLSNETKDSTLLNSIVEAVIRGDMNQVVSLALSHRSSDTKVKSAVDEVLSSLKEKPNINQQFNAENSVVSSKEDKVSTASSVNEIVENVNIQTNITADTSSYSPTDTDNKSVQLCYPMNTTTSNSDSNIYCQTAFVSQNLDMDNTCDENLSVNFTQYQPNTPQNIDGINSSNVSQSMQVQLPGIGNFLVQIPPNWKPGEPITLPLNLPLTPVSQSSAVNPIAINMNTGHIFSNQLLSVYNPSNNVNMSTGKKMRAIAPKPSKPPYRQPLLAPKSSSPNSLNVTLDGLSNVGSNPLPLPSGPGRRKGSKGKKSGRKRGAPVKSQKNSSYASSTHSIDSQETVQFNELNTTIKNCNISLGTRSTYQCNYYVNNESSDFINQCNVSNQFSEINSNTLVESTDSGEKDLLSLAWEISNAELGTGDDFSAAYHLYDTSNLTSDGFVSSEILDQFLQNIQKDDINDINRGSTSHISNDSRVSYASSYTTLPPCSTVLPSVATSNNPNNLELSQCIEIAEVVNLNTEDMLTELEKDDHSFLDKFVAHYSSHHSDTAKCHQHSMSATVNSCISDKTDLDLCQIRHISPNDLDKELDPNVKESNELSEIAKSIEKSCNLSSLETESIVESFSKGMNSVEDDLLKKNSSFNLAVNLMYANPNDSIDPIVRDKQNLLSTTVESKITNDNSFYISNSTLKSKTLDDFGLFELCSDKEISLGIKTFDQTNIHSEDNSKYMEPPILEDISDATPIQSESETDDEDIDSAAFKFSKLSVFSLLSANFILPPKEDLIFKSNLSDLPLLSDIVKLKHDDEDNGNDSAAIDWHINNFDITTNPELLIKNFECLPESSSSLDVNCQIDPNNKKPKEPIPVKTEKISENKKPQTVINRNNTTESVHFNQRLSRLRKPPKKLAIYQSINFIEKEFENSNCKDVKPITLCEPTRPLTNVEFKRYTRSKGKITKSFDSFYETLSKTTNKPNLKTKLVKLKSGSIGKLKSFESNTLESNVNKIKNLKTNILVNSVKDRVSKVGLIRNSTNMKSNDTRFSGKIVGKYNLRNDKLDLKSFRRDMQINPASPRISKPKKSNKQKDDVVERKLESPLNLNFSIMCHSDPTESSISVIPIVEYSKADFVSSVENPFVVSTVTCLEMFLSDVKVQEFPKSTVQESVCKKSFPVRKINRKLRLLSGLDNQKPIKYATVMEAENNDLSFLSSIFYLKSNIYVIDNCMISEDEVINQFPTLSSASIEHQTQIMLEDHASSDIDDMDSLDAPLIIVENEDSIDENLEKKVIRKQHSSVSNKCSKGDESSEMSDASKENPENSKYSLRRRIVLSTNNAVVKKTMKTPPKKLKSDNQMKPEEILSVDTFLSDITLKNPVCAINRLSEDELSKSLKSVDGEESIKVDTDVKDRSVTPLEKAYSRSRFPILRHHRRNKVTIKRKNIENNKNYVRYRYFKKRMFKQKTHENFWYKKKLLRILRRPAFVNKRKSLFENMEDNINVLEKGIARISIEVTEEEDDIHDNGYGIKSHAPASNIETYRGPECVTTISPDLKTISLKIKVQSSHKTDNNRVSSKKQKRVSKRCTKRYITRSISALDQNVIKITTERDGETESNRIKRKSRKRKASRDSSYSDDDIDTSYQDRPPDLIPEKCIENYEENQKPIKIKLFKSSNDEYVKSSCNLESNNTELINPKLNYIERPSPKILRLSQEQPTKPCRHAANLAKKKIFSTAKEDRRSQNATLTSIWSSRRPTNNSKLPNDILTSFQCDRLRRPRGRPPKTCQTLFLTDKQTTGTLKLKIKLSKDFKNCTDDNNSSTGENSGRTSTNDSSILNSAVAAINGPSDALSLDSNNYITDQLEQNIEYLEADEARVYFDPNQVDIERIKNSYFSSKRTHSDSLVEEPHDVIYENSSKKDLSNLRRLSEFDLTDSVIQPVINTMPKEYSLPNKVSHFNDETINEPDNCFKNNTSNREPQDLSQTNPSFTCELNAKNHNESWQNKGSGSDLSCRDNGSWFFGHRDQTFVNSSNIYESYMSSVKDNKSCVSNRNSTYVPQESEQNLNKRSPSAESRKSANNSSYSNSESHNQMSPHYSRGSIGPLPPQINIHPWSEESNQNALNHTAAAWMTYAQQQAAAAAYMDPQMKAYYNLALSQSMLNNPYCGSYGNAAVNSENFYSSLHSQYLNNSKEIAEKNNTTGRIHNDPMGSFMEAAQMSSWEQFYSAAAMAGYHNTSQGTVDDYTGRAGSMLQAHQMLSGGYPSSMLNRDHFSLENGKPPLAHQNQSGSTSPIKPVGSSSNSNTSLAYSHVQMPYSHFSGTPVGFF